MTQYSYPWPGRAPSDGVDAGPYDAPQWWGRLVALLGIGGVVDTDVPLKSAASRDNLGVLNDIGNELEVTNPSGSNIQIDTGAAVLDGNLHYNDTAITLAIPSPASNPRIDRIVVRKDYSASEYNPSGDAGDEEVPAVTSRITRLVGTEAVAPTAPSLTQDTSRVTYWDVPLAQFEIATDGTISNLTDEREYGPKWDTENFVDEAVTAAKIANRTRRFFVGAIAGYNQTDTKTLYLIYLGAGFHPGVSFEANDQSYGGGSFIVPEDFSSDLKVKALIVPQGDGDVYHKLTWRRSALCSTAFDTGTGGTSLTATTVVAYNKYCVLEDTVTGVSAGDFVEVEYTRRGDAGSDTCSDGVVLLGFAVEYTADS